jgi:hypothetical protein
MVISLGLQKLQILNRATSLIIRACILVLIACMHAQTLVSAKITVSFMVKMRGFTDLK